MAMSNGGSAEPRWQQCGLDRAQSLWLKPLKAGEHFLKLELLDGDGNRCSQRLTACQELVVPVSRAGAPAMFSPASTPISWLSSGPNYEPTPEPEPEPEPEAQLNLRPSLNSKSQQWQLRPNRAIQQPR